MHGFMMTVCHEPIQFCPSEGHLKEEEGMKKRKEWREEWKILNWHHCRPVSKLLVTHIISAQARWLPKLVWLCRLWAAQRSLIGSWVGFHQPVLCLPSKILGKDCVCPEEKHRNVLPHHPALSPVAVSVQRGHFVLIKSSTQRYFQRDLALGVELDQVTSKVPLNSRIFFRE